MTPSEAEAVIVVATLAALADGKQDPQEQATISAVATRLGLGADIVQRATSGRLAVSEVAATLVTDESRQSAYDAALAVCNGDGAPSLHEQAFLSTLASALKITPANAANPFAGADLSVAPPANMSVGTGPSPNATSDVDNQIVDQAILTAAMELLPDRLANLAILPLQMRMVYGIGQRHGQQLDAKQVADLAATFGIGAVAQVFEKVVRRALGGIAGGLLGGLMGGAGGVAAGATVTFASTYALGHAAEQYYAQNRSISVADMKTLFARFQAEATQLYPKVQERIRMRASGTSLSSVIQSMRR